MTVGFAVTAGWDLPVEDVSHVHAAVAMADAAVTHAGLAPADRAAFALIATELATNLARHARDGRLVATATEPGPAAWVQLAAADRGPGIPDVAAAMADGYSTANSLGGGLGACRRAATVFDLCTAASGTVVIARLGPGAPATLTVPSSPTGHVRVGGILAARAGERESGDAWGVAWGPGALTVVIMDGLGHGPEAAEAAATGMNVLAAQYGQPSPDDPVTLLGQLDRKLAGGRGAVAGVAQLSHGRLAFGGVGNIGARLGPAGSNHHARGLVSSMGTLGLGQRLRPQAAVTPWHATSLFTAHTDGIRSSWNLSRYPGVIQHDPAVMATLIWRDAATRGDDAAVIVVTAAGAGEAPS
jgi:anti-sigma regulatory factor (Ser/Thr protein kinase)